MSTVERLPIVVYPDPFLTRMCRAITPEEFKAGAAGDWKLEELVERMKETMYVEEGIGLAAPQVGVGLRIFTLDTSKDRSGFLAVFNPELSGQHGSALEEEGCLSIPGVRAKVKRFTHLKLSGQNVKGEPFAIENDELIARVCQHEFDHLNGVLFINRVGMAGKLRIRRKLMELEEDYALSQARAGRTAGVKR